MGSINLISLLLEKIIMERLRSLHLMLKDNLLCSAQIKVPILIIRNVSNVTYLIISTLIPIIAKYAIKAKLLIPIAENVLKPPL